MYIIFTQQTYTISYAIHMYVETIRFRYLFILIAYNIETILFQYSFSGYKVFFINLLLQFNVKAQVNT